MPEGQHVAVLDHSNKILMQPWQFERDPILRAMIALTTNG
jgi:hypothetical protein